MHYIDRVELILVLVWYNYTWDIWDIHLATSQLSLTLQLPDQIVILLTVNNTILIMLVQRI